MIGVLIPPSIPLIVYGVSANVSIGLLFVAGIVPGLLLGLCFAITSRLLVGSIDSQRSVDQAEESTENFVPFWDVLKRSFWAILTCQTFLATFSNGWKSFIFRNIILHDLCNNVKTIHMASILCRIRTSCLYPLHVGISGLLFIYHQAC